MSTAVPEPIPQASAARPVRTYPRQRWQIAPPHPESAELARTAHIPPVLAELLLARNITTAEQAHAFLHPHPSHLHDPMQMKGMAIAVERLERAIAAREPILLYGDYDVDGTTAVVLLKTTIEMLGGIVRFHVPHRIREGYGMQSGVLEEAYAGGARVVVTVDTGMRAFAEADTARRLGLDLIITDHHLPSADEAIPDALAILNPNQPGCTYPEKSLCGAAIALKVAQALLERRDPVRAREKILPSFLKMAAIATIADAVPLRGENRVIAALGIRELRHPVGAGLRALFSVAQLDPATRPLTGFDLAFRLGPRINAAGRMDVASDVIELFCTRDAERARDLAQKLEDLNRQRREAEAEALAIIERRLADEADFASARLLVIDGEGWHRGVIGILASRVVERTAKPTLVISIEDGVAHGSGRSVEGLQLLDAIETCRDLFTRFGGHAFAVGFAMPAGAVPELRRRLDLYARKCLAGCEPEHVLRIHAEVPLDRITPVLAGALRDLEPLGHGNSEPVFLARGVRLANAPRPMKERHIRLELLQGTARVPMKCVGWDWASRCSDLQLAAGTMVDVAYKIRENEHPEYGGIEIELAGLRPAD